ncbi:hypothetical protein B0H34DRAFT_673310 [Crassisporium funariophilum]|nr:hypothetical protein B0H34DRAFT_673310 [Crassisporium funariophilum]
MSERQPLRNLFKSTSGKLIRVKSKLKHALSPTPRSLIDPDGCDPACPSSSSSPISPPAVEFASGVSGATTSTSIERQPSNSALPKSGGAADPRLSGPLPTRGDSERSPSTELDSSSITMDTTSSDPPTSRSPKTTETGAMLDTVNPLLASIAPLAISADSKLETNGLSGTLTKELSIEIPSPVTTVNSPSYFSGANNLFLNNVTFNAANTIMNVGISTEAQSVEDQVFQQKPNSSQRFMGRKHVLEKLKAHFASRVNGDRRYFLLYGMGGIGKTQICLKLSEEMSDSFSFVFWIDASSSDTITVSLKGLSSLPEAKLSGVDGSAQSILQWISYLQTDWLLIFDNADGAPEVVERFIPPGSRGNILITSRNPSVGRITSYANSLELAQMEEEDCISLLLTTSALGSGAPNLRETALEIVTELCCLPLAVDQAGASIASGLCSVEEYLGLFSEARKDLMQYSSFMGASTYEKTVYGTWELSYKEIELRAAATKIDGYKSQAAQTALLILQTCAFFHHDNIIEDIFCHAAEQARKRDIPKEESRGLPLAISSLDYRLLSVNGSGTWNKISFRRGIELLLSFSLIKRGLSINTFSIHPLVHHWSQDHLAREDQQAACSMGRAILSCAVPLNERSEDYAMRRSLLPHMKANYKFGAQVGLAHIYKDDEWGRYALICQEAGNWTEAAKVKSDIVEQRTKILGKENSDTLKGMASLAWTYHAQGWWKEAEKLGVYVLEVRRRMLGPEHPDTLRSMANLTVFYGKQGKYKEAEELEAQVLEVRKRVLGPEHPETLISLGNLATYHSYQGNWKEAEGMEIKVLEARKRILGAEHPDTLWSMTNLGGYYFKQGNWYEADALESEVLEIRRVLLGPEHPDTLRSMGNLAVYYSNQGKWKDSEALKIKVLEARKRLLGPEHPEALQSMASLAVDYSKQGNWKEAEALALQVLEVRKRVLGPEHPDTIQSMGNLAVYYSNQGKWKESEALKVQVVEARKRFLGPDHPDTLWSMASLAVTYSKQRKLQESEELEIQVLAARKRLLGPKHPETLRSMANLAFTLYRQSHVEEAISLMQDTVALRKEVLGNEHPDTAESEEALGWWLG